MEDSERGLAANGRERERQGRGLEEAGGGHSLSFWWPGFPKEKPMGEEDGEGKERTRLWKPRKEGMEEEEERKSFDQSHAAEGKEEEEQG